MKVIDVDIVDILLIGIPSSAHESDHVARIHGLPHRQSLGKGCVLLQMGIVIIPLAVVTADAHPPAAVAIPAQRFHHAAFHRNNGSALTSQQIVPQVLPLKAEGAVGTEIVIVRIVKPFCDGAKRLQAVLRHPLAILLDCKAAQKAPQHGTICLAVIAEILILIPQDALGRALLLQIGDSFFNGIQAAFSAGSAGGNGKNVDPVDMIFLLEGLNIRIHGIFH